MFPLIPGVIPFAMISGMAAIDAGLDPLTAQLYSILVFAGASQIAAAQLIAAGASAWVIIFTIWIINLRFMMYSAALSTKIPPSPIPKVLQAYILTDQAFAVCMGRFDLNMVDKAERAWFYLSSSVIMWCVWQAATAVGIVFGAVIPASWSLDFGVSLCFIAILIPALRDRPTLAAALAGGGFALLFYALPYNLGLVLASVTGIAVGYFCEQSLKKSVAAKNKVLEPDHE